MHQLQEFIAYFEDSGLADNIRENDLLFPLIELVHVLSICLVVGSIFVVDLRLLGLASIRRPVGRVINGILPLTWSAFAIAVASGSLLFISNATKYLANGYFVAKIFLILAAGLNMAIFHAISAKDLPKWENEPAPPFRRGWREVCPFCCGFRWSHADAGSDLPCRSLEHDRHTSVSFPAPCRARHGLPHRLAVDLRRRGRDAAVSSPCRHEDLHAACA